MPSPTLQTPTDTVAAADIDRELAGLDALELAGRERKALGPRLWAGAWPKLLALAFVLFAWQLVNWTGWKPDYVLPGPYPVLKQFWESLSSGEFTQSGLLFTTLRRALIGFTAAVIVGTVIGALMSQVKVLRTGAASLVTGLQTMPSVLWYPMALVLFKLGEGAIMFVVIIGAAPSVANGILAGADQVPPILMRAGRVLGAKRFTLWKEVVLPASLPAFVSGLKQGWAFSWRSLMAGELIGAATGSPGIGGYLDIQRTNVDYTSMYAAMILILVIGVGVDTIFNLAEKSINRRRGLIDAAA